jgi:lipid-A-disaccharide synthase
MNVKRILIIAGEPSGDLHASNLIRELKKLSPETEIFGTGGDKMKAAGAEIIFHLRDLAVTGLFDVIKTFPKLKKIQKTLLSFLMDSRLRGNDSSFGVMPAEAGIHKIDLIILVDYPDFNLRFAKKVHQLGVPVIYYIPPQVWAWRKGRVNFIKKYITKVYCIFKFEGEIYKKAGIPVEFVGHPLLDVVKIEAGRRKEEGGSGEEKTIALLPGSRTSLIKRHLPIMLKAAKLISDKFPNVRFLTSRSPGDALELIAASDAVIVTSGTATLETAILEKPMVIIYKLPLLEYLIAKPLLLLKNIGLVNIVAGRQVVPELIQFKATPKLIAKAMIGILTDKQKYGEIKSNLAAVKNSLYPPGASSRAAASILKLLQN